MANNDAETLRKILQELEHNKFAKLMAERWHEQAKTRMQTTFMIVAAVLITMLLLNWGERLTQETNGWLLAALVGYLFGRGTQN